MAIGANSYGSVAEVEALVTRYTASGSFTSATRPTLIQVEKFIDRVSGILNWLLAENGFAIPVIQADAKLALDEFSVAQVTQLAHAANGAGVYAPGNEELRNGRTPFQIILSEANSLISKHAEGLEALGATRNRLLTAGLQCRLEDAAGNPLVPFFSRKQFGNQIIDWDVDE